MRVRALFIALFSLTIIITACGSNTSDKTSKYEFETTDIQGEPIGLSDENPTLIYFMAAWCPTCIGEEKVFAELHKQYGNKVQFITVDVAPSMDTKVWWELATCS